MKPEKCKRCGAKWIKRTSKPVQCPRCHSPYWNKPRTRKRSLINREVGYITSEGDRV